MGKSSRSQSGLVLVIRLLALLIAMAGLLWMLALFVQIAQTYSALVFFQLGLACLVSTLAMVLLVSPRLFIGLIEKITGGR